MFSEVDSSAQGLVSVLLISSSHLLRAVQPRTQGLGTHGPTRRPLLASFDLNNCTLVTMLVPSIAPINFSIALVLLPGQRKEDSVLRLGFRFCLGLAEEGLVCLGITWRLAR